MLQIETYGWRWCCWCRLLRMVIKFTDVETSFPIVQLANSKWWVLRPQIELPIQTVRPYPALAGRQMTFSQMFQLIRFIFFIFLRIPAIHYFQPYVRYSRKSLFSAFGKTLKFVVIFPFQKSFGLLFFSFTMKFISCIVTECLFAEDEEATEDRPDECFEGHF